MTTSFFVDSGRCDHRTQIIAELNGKVVTLRINTTCPSVKKYAEALREVSVIDLTNPVLKNPVYIAASSTLGPECVVPCAVISATWTEAGMVAKSILNRYPRTCFTYESSSDSRV